MAYAAPSDMAERFDERIIKDLASDTGQAVASITADTKVLAALDDGAGRIDSAATVGQQYTSANLAALTGTALSLLKRLNCELAMLFLMGRRQDKWLSDGYEKMERRCEEQLERIRKGERVFGLTANRDAGLPTIDGPTTTEYRDLYLVRDRVQNFYPARVLPGLR